MSVCVCATRVSVRFDTIRNKTRRLWDAYTNGTVYVDIDGYRGTTRKKMKKKNDYDERVSFKDVRAALRCRARACAARAARKARAANGDAVSSLVFFSASP